MANLLITYCRYYKGEAKNPFAISSEQATFWEWERMWNRMQEGKDPKVEDLVSGYVSAGLFGFEESDIAPISLKAWLWNRYSHWTGNEDVSAFKIWYKTSYKKAEE